VETKEATFKFGLTIKNCPKPNLAESFDLLGSMEAFDTYANLKVAIFDHFQEELGHLCCLNPNCAKLLVMQDADGFPVLVQTVHANVKSPLLKPMIEMQREEVSSSSSWFSADGNGDAVLCSDGGKIWGMALLDSEGRVE